MSKPEDVPQRIWDEVEAMDLNIFVSASTSTPARAERMRKSIISKAILAAEQREREACAQVARNYSAEHASMAVDALDLSRPLDLATATQASLVSGHIASAIANRGSSHD